MNMLKSFIEYQRDGSNWVLCKVLGVTVYIVRYNPMKDSIYMYIYRHQQNLPGKRPCRRLDYWSIVFHVVVISCHHSSNGVSATSYEIYVTHRQARLPRHSNSCRIGGIPKFETRNDISIYVFIYEKRETHPLHLTRERRLKHVDSNQGDKSHYCWITNLNIIMNMDKREINYFIAISISIDFLKSGF